MIPSVTVNFVAVLGAAIASMVVGFVWYSPVLFGNLWMKLSKKKMDAKGNPTKAYMTAFAGAIVAAYVLAHIISYAGAVTLMDGAFAGFWAWLGFIATTETVNAVFDEKPMQLVALGLGHHLLSFLVMGAVLVAMA